MSWVVALVLAVTAAARGGDLALLIGIRGVSGYRTLYFTGSRQGLRLSGHWPFILVPSGRGRPCAVRIAEVPHTGFTHAAVGLSCATRLGAPPPPAERLEGCSGWEKLDLVFASSQYLAFESTHETVCANVSSAHRLQVQRVADVEDRWVLGQDLRALTPGDVFGRGGADAFQNAAKTACHEYFRSPRGRDAYGDIEGEVLGMPDCDERLVPDWFDNWAIQRGRRAFEVVGRIQAWRTNHLDFVVPLPVPGAQVASAQPAGTAPLLDRVLRMSLAPDEQLVLLEWATGDRAREWSVWAADPAVRAGGEP